LSGDQGIGKTTFIRELGLGKWYGELTSFDPKIAMEEISGKWIIEIDEMGATNKHELEAQKSFYRRSIQRSGWHTPVTLLISNVSAFLSGLQSDGVFKGQHRKPEMVAHRLS